MFDNLALDLSDVSTGVEVVPEGYYRLKLTNHMLYMSNQNQPAFRVTFTIVQPEDFYGKPLRSLSSSLQPHALGTFKRVIAALGAPDDVLSHKRANPNEILMQLRGNECDAQVTVKPYQNRPQNEIYPLLPGELERNMALLAKSNGDVSGSWDAPPPNEPTV